MTLVDPQLLQGAPYHGQLIDGVVDDEVPRQAGERGLPAEQAGAEGVERQEPEPRLRGAEEPLDALAHLLGGLVRERDGQELVRRRVPLGDQAGGAMRDDAGLAGAGAGQDQERAVAVQHRLPLLRVEVLEEPHRLLDRDALGQVARLIDIAAPQDRNVVREQLQGHRRPGWE